MTRPRSVKDGPASSPFSLVVESIVHGHDLFGLRVHAIDGQVEVPVVRVAVQGIHGLVPCEAHLLKKEGGNCRIGLGRRGPLPLPPAHDPVLDWLRTALRRLRPSPSADPRDRRGFGAHDSTPCSFGQAPSQTRRPLYSGRPIPPGVTRSPNPETNARRAVELDRGGTRRRVLIINVTSSGIEPVRSALAPHPQHRCAARLKAA
jgi:hypothetical protein